MNESKNAGQNLSRRDLSSFFYKIGNQKTTTAISEDGEAVLFLHLVLDEEDSRVGQSPFPKEIVMPIYNRDYKAFVRSFRKIADWIEDTARESGLEKSESE